MKVAIVGNDLRSLALAHRTWQDGGVPVLIPGPHGFVAEFPASVRGIESGADVLPWQEMGFVNSIVDAVTATEPDLVVCLHVESSKAGVCDELRKAAQSRGGWSVFGVNQACSQLETSKACGLRFASDAGLTVPATKVIEPHMRAAWEHALLSSPFQPVVIKADGLAGGRGTHLASHPTELPAALAAVGSGRVICQELVQGHEVALSMLCNGAEIEIVDVNFEYKRAREGDTGPNTSGMGSISYAPSCYLNAAGIFPGLSHELAMLGYHGPLDINFIINGDGCPVFLEFTTRFGDPEFCVQVAMRRGLTNALWNIARERRGQLEPADWSWAGCVIARGIPWPLVTGGMNASAVYHCWRESLMEVCYVTTASSAALCQGALGRIAQALPDGTHHRKDIGHDVEERWRCAHRWLNAVSHGDFR